jgi:hypothetical protein
VLDVAVVVRVDRAAGEPQRVGHGGLVRAPVPDHHDAVDAEQARAPVGRVVDRPADPGEGLAAPVGVAFEQLSQHEPQHERGEVLQELQDDVAREAVHDDHVAAAPEEVTALDVADEGEVGVLELLVRLLEDVRALALLFPDVQDPRLV